MRFGSIILLCGLFLFGACTSPQQSLEQGDLERALEKSSKKLRRGKVKNRHLDVFEQAFNSLNQDDRHLLDSMVASGSAEDWSEIYAVSSLIEARQTAAQPIVDRLRDKGLAPKLHFIEIESLRAEAQQKAAIYAYARAQENLPMARRGDRRAAREAHRWLSEAESYLPNFRDARQIAQEMWILGNNHVLVNPIPDQWEEFLSTELFETLLWDQKFPFREGWQTYHLQPSTEQKIHYRLDVFFDRFQSTGNELYVDECVNTAQVEDGYEEVQEWSPQDSAFILVNRPTYINVSANIQTSEQYKAVSIELHCQLYDLENQRLLYRRELQDKADWQNLYSDWSGDERAINGGRCDFFVGGPTDYPDEEDLFEDAVSYLRWPFFQSLQEEWE
ncbi:MAG: hypothetical protein AAFW73_25550 [Bacteroidota bacterium]